MQCNLESGFTNDHSLRLHLMREHTISRNSPRFSCRTFEMTSAVARLQVKQRIQACDHAVIHRSHRPCACVIKSLNRPAAAAWPASGGPGIAPMPKPLPHLLAGGGRVCVPRPRWKEQEARPFRSAEEADLACSALAGGCCGRGAFASLRSGGLAPAVRCKPVCWPRLSGHLRALLHVRVLGELAGHVVPSTPPCGPSTRPSCSQSGRRLDCTQRPGRGPEFEAVRKAAAALLPHAVAVPK